MENNHSSLPNVIYLTPARSFAVFTLGPLAIPPAAETVIQSSCYSQERKGCSWDVTHLMHLWDTLGLKELLFPTERVD